VTKTLVLFMQSTGCLFCGFQWVVSAMGAVIKGHQPANRRGLVGTGNKHTNTHSHSGILVAMQCRICGRVFDPFAPFRFFSVAIFMYGLCRSSRVRFYGFRWCLWGVGVAGDIGQYKTVTHRGPDPQITPSNHGNSPFHPAL